MTRSKLAPIKVIRRLPKIERFTWRIIPKISALCPIVEGTPLESAIIFLFSSIVSLGSVIFRAVLEIQPQADHRWLAKGPASLRHAAATGREE